MKANHEVKGLLVPTFPEPVVLEGKKIDREEHGVYKPFYIKYIDTLR